MIWLHMSVARYGSENIHAKALTDDGSGGGSLEEREAKETVLAAVLARSLFSARSVARLWRFVMYLFPTRAISIRS